MNYTKIKKTVLSTGFTSVEVIPVTALTFRPEFRKYCIDNACGNYGRNYACPPNCGTAEEMKQRVLRHQNALVFQSRCQVMDAFDDTLTKPLKKRHTQMTLQAVKNCHSLNLPENGLFIMAGPCNFCDVCSLQKDAPCCHEELRFSCLSAYCIDVTALANSCGMDISWDGNTVSFFSLYCF